MREKLRYWLYYAIFRTIALLPTPVLQWIGSGLRWLWEDVLKYRRKIIRDNLRNSFPGITDG
ncbi:MAG: acetyltransferase, partial [Duncaniella sp.]|nr:acetyltransferase [Duncaniella sp.]